RGPVDPVSHRERGVVALAGVVSPFSELTHVTLPTSRMAALLGDLLAFGGLNLDGSGHALHLSNPRLSLDRTVTPASAAAPNAVSFILPNQPTNFPAGTYAASIG